MVINVLQRKTGEREARVSMDFHASLPNTHGFQGRVGTWIPVLIGIDGNPDFHQCLFVFGNRNGDRGDIPSYPRYQTHPI